MLEKKEIWSKSQFAEDDMAFAIHVFFETLRRTSFMLRSTSQTTQNFGLIGDCFYFWN